MAMANPNAGTDTNRNENISNFNPPQRNQKTGLLEWPALPKIDVPLNSCEGQWLDHYPPSELRKIAIDCPEDVPRIVRQSLQKEQYILVVGSLVVEDADAAGPQSKEKKCSKDGDASSHLSRNSCAVSIRSEVSRHRKSFSGAKAWLTAKGKAGAGTGERGVRKLLRERAASAPEIRLEFLVINKSSISDNPLVNAAAASKTPPPSRWSLSRASTNTARRASSNSSKRPCVWRVCFPPSAV